MATIDNAEWHYAGGSFPSGLPLQNAGTHIGMFLAWAIDRDLASPFLRQLLGPSLELIRQRRLTGRDALFSQLDERLTDNMLSAEGQRFARWYYRDELYLLDFSTVAARGLPTAYHVEDSWDCFDVLADRITQRFRSFQASAPESTGALADADNDAVSRYAEVVSAAMRALPSDPPRAVWLLERFADAELMLLVSGMARREAARLRERFKL